MKKISKKLRYGTLSLTIIIGVIVVAVALNVILGMVGERVPLIIDLTKEKNYKLTSDTTDFIKKLDTDIEITVLNDELKFQQASDYIGQSDYMKQAYMLINEYKQWSDRINVNYIDLDKNPAFFSNYPGETLEPNGIIISGNGNHKVLSLGDLFDIKLDTTYFIEYFAGSKVEQAITSGINSVISESPIITILEGHDRADTSALEALLKRNNFSIKTINISTDKIDENSSVVVIPAPKIDYSQVEIDKLAAYMNSTVRKSRALVVIYSHEQPELPNLDEYMKEWGIAVKPGVVYATKGKLDQSGLWLLPKYEEEIFAKDLLEKGRYVTIENARAFELLFDKSTFGRTTSNILTAFGTIGLDEKKESDFFTIMAKCERQDTHNNELYTGTAVAVGSQSFLGEFLNDTQFANAEFTLNMFNSLSNRQDTLNILPRVLKAKMMPANFTVDKARVIGLYIFTLLLPLAVLAAGLVIWLRRRHL